MSYFCAPINGHILAVLIKPLNIALVGNPNSGKSSLFNVLTGLKQKVGNFPGVTVDKKTGTASISEKIKANIIDLPGTYSLYPKRADEWVAYKVLLNQDEEIFHPKEGRNRASQTKLRIDCFLHKSYIYGQAYD